MNIFQAIVLGIIQGITEFLPISSSAHLVLVPLLFGWEYQGLSFDVSLHTGTLFGIVVYFYSDWLKIIKSALKNTKTVEKKLFWYLVISTIPAAVSGYLLEEKAETVFRSPIIIAISLITGSIILLFSDLIGSKKHDMEKINLWKSLIIGFSQATAIIPGVSRSGITISAGLFCGLNREDAAKFSFLLATPIIFGAGLLSFKNISLTQINSAFIVGFIASGISGFISIKFLLYYLKKFNLMIFVVYRIILGIIIIMT